MVTEPKEALTARVGVYFTDGERWRMRQLAFSQHKSFQDWAREVLLRELEREAPAT